MFRFILILFCLLTGFSWADLAQETLYLTWQQSPSTTMTIQWISTPQEKESIVFYAPVMNQQEWLKATGESFPFPQSPQYLIHRVELKNLKPNSEYRFKIAPSNTPYQFLTAPSELVKELKFVVGGDMYHDAMQYMAKTCQRAALTNPTFAVLGGDIAYAVKTRISKEQNERWIEWLKTWHSTMVTPRGNMIPVISALGNHDLIGQFGQSPAQAAVFTQLFPMPGKTVYNVLDFNNYLSIILLDSGHANPIEGAQTQWLSSALEKRKQVLHRFAVYHVPAYPSARKFQNKESELIRNHWVPLFEKFSLPVAFEHHDHAYKRTYPLLKGSVDSKGVVYMGDGGWGVEKPRKLRTKRKYFAKFAPARHFILVTLTPTQEIIKSIDDKGQVVDEYTKVVR